MLVLRTTNKLFMRKLLTAIIGITTSISLSTTAAILAGTTPGVAETKIAQQPNCKNPQTQVEMNICEELRYQKNDKKLNQAYQKLLPKYSGSQRQKLIAAQQAWIKFRDLSCTFEESQVEGGSMAPMIYSGCLAELTKQRTAQLEQYLKEAF
ncbi:protein of unknown function DUF1311 [Crinalium epipsammum PCC 9333]|uniref:Lysozyme inhibitor LprI-like N-terminal domain-containing protein n=2 Tax=Crinalium TaxID=241421 RepID=K9W2A2_9CYAN|nr:protein of unknown function DUF1311 [Crinalium epipsammum PCC 9333]